MRSQQEAAAAAAAAAAEQQQQQEEEDAAAAAAAGEDEDMESEADDARTKLENFKVKSTCALRFGQVIRYIAMFAIGIR